MENISVTLCPFIVKFPTNYAVQRCQLRCHIF